MYKDMADEYDTFLMKNTRDSKTRYMLGVTDTEAQYRKKLSAYVAFLRGKKGLEDDLRKAVQLQAAHRLRVITVTSDVLVNDKNEWNVSSLHQYFIDQAGGAAYVQHVVFISDWRKLAVDAIVQNVTLLTTMNLLITEEGRLKLETLAAIQA
jgi:hypothetical protein